MLLTLLTTIFLLIVEIARKFFNFKTPLISDLILYCGKEYEKKFIAIEAILYFFALFVISFFDKVSSFIGATTLIIGDFCSSMIGVLFGSTFFKTKKIVSIEGFIAFIIGVLPFYSLFIPLEKAFQLAFLMALLECILAKEENFVLPIVATSFSKFLFGS